MAQMEVAMFESVTAKTKNVSAMNKQARPRRECRLRKRPYDLEQFTSKRAKYEPTEASEPAENSCTFGLASDSDEDNDTESKCSTSDETEQPTAAVAATTRHVDDNSDLEEIEEDTTNVYFSKASSDQHRYIPVVANDAIIRQQQQATSRHSKRLMGQFKYMYNRGLRKAVQTTNSSEPHSRLTNDIYREPLRWELRNTFNRIDLFKEGYCVLSTDAFPFYSLCYMCGSLGSDLIYCNGCCEAYHPCCLNEYERPPLHPPADSWLCPNCNVCTICGLLTARNVLSRLTNEHSPSSQLISCSDCRRNFHPKCLKRLKDDQWTEIIQMNNANNNNNPSTPSVVSLSRLSNSYLLNQSWQCPSCIKCDCGQALVSHERNLLSLGKTLSSQQLLMCFDCLTNMKLLRLHKNEHIEKCHLCDKYIEQIFIKQENNCLLHCWKCKHRFHPKCDGYLNEDALVILHTKNLSCKMVCSKCDHDESDRIRQRLAEYKLQAMESSTTNVASLLQVITPEDEHCQRVQSSLSNLQRLHESRHQSIHLHAFLNDLLVLIRRLSSNVDLYRWQSAIDGCILRQCPWFKSASFLSTTKIIPRLPALDQTTPCIDHGYASSTVRPVSGSNLARTHLFTAADSLLRYIDENTNDDDGGNPFGNLHDQDRRKCQLCDTLSDRVSSPVGRLISFGIDQWVHVGCILPAYAKNLDQPPYILRNIRETVLRCQTKYFCALCSKLGASVHCYENECYQRFHCDCIQKYYSNVDQHVPHQLNIKNGFLPNLTTLCLRHNGLRNSNKVHRDSSDLANDEQTNEGGAPNGIHIPKLKTVNISSTVYGDLTNNTIEFALINARLCIGSLQVNALGNFDYLLDRTTDNFLTDRTYPNEYRASRLFWSMENARRRTMYHLHIEVEQTYHHQSGNHRAIAYPLTDEQMRVEQLYDQCRAYFRKIQKEIDEHINYVDEFCQKTMVNKKSKANDASQNATGSSQGRKKNANAGGIGTTKRLTKATPSCVKRQTPKAALKNVSRPRNRFANEKQTQMTLTTKQTPSHTKPVDNATRDATINDLQTLFNNGYFKTTNVSQFALALAHALTHVGQVLPQPSKTQQSGSNYYLSDQTHNPANGSTVEKHSDVLLKQLLMNITAPQQSHDPSLSNVQFPTVSSQRHPTMTNPTDTISLAKLCDETKINGHASHSFLTWNGTKLIPATTDSTVNLLPKQNGIPQVDGAFDIDDDDDDLQASSTVIESIMDRIDAECCRTDSEHSMDLSDCVLDPSVIHMPPMSPTNGAPTVQTKPNSSHELIQLFQQWSSSTSGRVKFTITNDEGFEVVSDDLDSAWSDIIQSVRSCRDDMNLTHLPMTNDELNGHRIFGLTKPIVQILLNQMYNHTSSTEQQIGNIILPLSSSSSSTQSTETWNKKPPRLPCSRTNLHERRTRERQRFGWLLNQSRKIAYALQSFEIDDALAHARRILLEEASVSLRLYHLHYFSHRALLVGSSPIHGCGLFTLIDLIEGQMIIEYTGEVVRPCLTDKRERENEGKGFGCYMFTVDSMHVIDATHRGDKARFINHNCQPNCFAKTVLSGGVKHIVIYALMDIAHGSELTYDYSFPEEDVKIPCHCGTSNCRVYLN